jgi:hypothetical protein
MARREKRSERSKIDATPPWERRKPPPIDTTTGPFDITDAPDDELARVDLGALHVPVSELELRLDVSETQDVVSVTLVGANGQMQLGAFAAPRSEGIWDEVRAEIGVALGDRDAAPDRRRAGDGSAAGARADPAAAAAGCGGADRGRAGRAVTGRGVGGRAVGSGCADARRGLGC